MFHLDYTWEKSTIYCNETVFMFMLATLRRIIQSTLYLIWGSTVYLIRCSIFTVSLLYVGYTREESTDYDGLDVI